MGEPDFWDDLKNFEVGGGDAVAGENMSLFDDSVLFAAEALDAASPAEVSPGPMSPASPPRLEPTDPAQLPELQLSVATGDPVAEAPAPLAPLAPLSLQAPPAPRVPAALPARFAPLAPPAVSAPPALPTPHVHPPLTDWPLSVGGSFFDDDSPLRQRVKITITSGKGKDRQRKKRPLEHSAVALGATKAAVVADPPPKRPRTGMKIQTTLCFAPAGNSDQPSFCLDIRKGAQNRKSASAVEGTKCAKKRVEKSVGMVRKVIPKARVPPRVAPAPRAKTLSSAQMTPTTGHVAKSATTEFAKYGFGVSPVSGEIVTAGPVPRSRKAIKLAAATANAAARARRVRTATARAATAAALVGGKEKAFISDSPTTPDALSFVTPDMSSRLADAACAKRGEHSDANSAVSAPLLLPALEAVNSASSAYRAILDDDPPEHLEGNMDLDYDFLARVLG